MMLFPTLFIIFVSGAVFGDEETCRDQAAINCNVTRLFEKIAESMEDLKNKCIVAQDVIKCLQEEHKKCELRYFDPVKMEELAQFLETNCDEGSSLYQALSRNFDCIKNTALNKNEQCIRYEIMYHEDMANMVSKAGGIPRVAEGCEYPLLEITCLAFFIDKECGEEAKETVTELLQNTKFEFLRCNEESILRDLQPLKEVFESTLTASLQEENAIP